jgi:pimeloyl-ACP methyl ester carboxylesterase
MARQSFQSPAADRELEMLTGTDSEEISVAVLSAMNPDLSSLVLAPFETDETVLNYAHQLTDFWSYDSRLKAQEIRLPVLLLGAEYDQLATPATSEMAAELFPNAYHVHVPGATHYCLYDRAKFVAGLLTTFFENPDNVNATNRVRQAAAAVQ